MEINLLKPVVHRHRVVISNRITWITKIGKRIPLEVMQGKLPSLIQNKSYIRTLDESKAEQGSPKKSHQDSVINKQISQQNLRFCKRIKGCPHKGNRQKNAFGVQHDPYILINLISGHLLPLQKSFSDLGRFFIATIREKPPIPKYTGQRIEGQTVSPFLHHQSCAQSAEKRSIKNLLTIQLDLIKLTSFIVCKCLEAHNSYSFHFQDSKKFLIRHSVNTLFLIISPVVPNKTSKNRTVLILNMTNQTIHPITPKLIQVTAQGFSIKTRIAPQDYALDQIIIEFFLNRFIPYVQILKGLLIELKNPLSPTLWKDGHLTFSASMLLIYYIGVLRCSIRINHDLQLTLSGGKPLHARLS